MSYVTEYLVQQRIADLRSEAARRGLARDARAARAAAGRPSQRPAAGHWWSRLARTGTMTTRQA